MCPGNSTEVEDCILAECPGELKTLILYSSSFSFIYICIATHVLLNSGIDGEWLEWGEWSHCDPSCSCGQKFRARECKDPLFGGNDCVGDSTEMEACSSGCCANTVSRIRSVESPYQPSCPNTTSPGWFGFCIAFDD